MKVSLAAYTMPEVPDLNPESYIAYVARVSNPNNQMNTGTAGKLLNYLKEHKHWSPFEMAHATLYIETTRDIARQLLRHRTFSFQEFSQRYANAEWFATPREARLQDTKNRQNSLTNEDQELADWWENTQNDLIVHARDAYADAVNRGIAKEQARAVLPEGLTMSRLYMTGSVRSWMHYVEVRTDPSTQKEHRELAEECRVTLRGIFPSLF